MTIYVVVFSSTHKRFQTLNSKNVKWKVQDVPSHNNSTPHAKMIWANKSSTQSPSKQTVVSL